MKKLLELLEQALKCEQVATITITIKPVSYTHLTLPTNSRV